jgi:hypothetical protein
MPKYIFWEGEKQEVVQCYPDIEGQFLRIDQKRADNGFFMFWDGWL